MATLKKTFPTSKEFTVAVNNCNCEQADTKKNQQKLDVGNSGMPLSFRGFVFVRESRSFFQDGRIQFPNLSIWVESCCSPCLYALDRQELFSP
jgi:hypothetical protein